LNSLSPHQPPGKNEGLQSLRIDKWLWAARFFKTRTLAADAVKAGHVQIDGQRCKASREVHIGQTLSILRGDVRFEVKVEGLSAQRGPAPVAQTLYAETPESRQAPDEAQRLRKEAPQSPARRPTKRDRRAVDRWNAVQSDDAELGS
jgi:ribosome-associated heat shock protein Hsp15